LIHRQKAADTQAYLDPAIDHLGKGGKSWSWISKKSAIRRSEPTETPISDLEDTVTARSAANFLDHYAGSKPFFMAVGLHKPHLAWEVPQKFYDRYDLNAINVPEIDGLGIDELPAFFRNMIGSGGGGRLHEWIEKRGDWADLLQAYFAAISYSDAQIGKVLRAMDRGEHWDDTTFVFFSDHGYHLGDRDLWGKFTLWEEAASIPMIIADPDLKRGMVSTTPASLLDVWPTIASLARAPAPAHTNGVDLTADHGREGVITSAFGSLSLRTAEWRYTVYQDGEEELFQIDDIKHAKPIQNADPAVLADLRATLKAEAKAFYDVHVVDDRTVGSKEADTFVMIGESTAVGGRGDDTFFVTGDSVVKAGKGYDTAMVSADRYEMPDNVEAGKIVGRAHGTLIGNAHANKMNGGSKADVLKGGRGGDRISGGDGRDDLRGNLGRDKLFGDSGADTLSGGMANDKLTGGPGADAFVFRDGWGTDRIMDFEKNVDTLRLDAALWGGGMKRAEVVDRFGTKTPHGVVLDFGDGDEIFVDGIGLYALKIGLEFF
jgi:serralysin